MHYFGGFFKEFECSPPKSCEDDEEGFSVCVMLSHLQRAKVGSFLPEFVGLLICKCQKQGEICCQVDLWDRRQEKLVATVQNQWIGHVLITRLELTT